MSAGDPGFDARALEARYAFLDPLPETLYAPIVTMWRGELQERVESVLALRRALLMGELPATDVLSWPERALRQALLEGLQKLRIAPFCREQPELVDALLLDVLKAVEEEPISAEVALKRYLAELTAREEAKRKSAVQKAQQSASPGAKRRARVPGPLDKETLRRLREEAAALGTKEAREEAARSLVDAWGEQVKVWSALREVFGELGDLLGLGWDLSQGVLRSQGWREMLRLRQLLQHLPQLQQLIQTLGRMKTSERDDAPSIIEEIIGPICRRHEEERLIHSPLVPSETRGIQRSGEIARMLPSEAVLLTQPVLKRLWHARRAERSLLTYLVEGIYAERLEAEGELQETRKRPTPNKLERGPILLCLDTSGSMHGAPEVIAKALTLEAMRVAHQERRACYLYAFSGPGQVAEHALSLNKEGITSLLGFLMMSFHGGTDVVEPLRRATQRLEEEGWSRADILLISDGEFPVPREIVADLKQARERHALKVHGLLIGAAQSAMEVICDLLHHFQEWEALIRR